MGCRCTFQGNSCDGFYRPGANGTQKGNWTKAFHIGTGNDLLMKTVNFYILGVGD